MANDVQLHLSLSGPAHALLERAMQIFKTRSTAEVVRRALDATRFYALPTEDMQKLADIFGLTYTTGMHPLHIRVPEETKAIMDGLDGTTYSQKIDRAIMLLSVLITDLENTTRPYPRRHDARWMAAIL